MPKKTGKRRPGNPANRRKVNELPAVDGHERDRHEVALQMLGMLGPPPPDTWWDASILPDEDIQEDLLERVFGRIFDMPEDRRLKFRAILESFWQVDGSPAALLYCVAYHYPAVPPWGVPLPPFKTVFENARELLSCSRVPAQSELMLAVLFWRLAYHTDELGEPLPPPPEGSYPAWQEAFDEGIRSHPDKPMWSL